MQHQLGPGMAGVTETCDLWWQKWFLIKYGDSCIFLSGFVWGFGCLFVWLVGWLIGVFCFVLLVFLWRKTSPFFCRCLVGRHLFMSKIRTLISLVSMKGFLCEGGSVSTAEAGMKLVKVMLPWIGEQESQQEGVRAARLGWGNQLTGREACTFLFKFIESGGKMQLSASWLVPDVMEWVGKSFEVSQTVFSSSWQGTGLQDVLTNNSRSVANGIYLNSFGSAANTQFNLRHSLQNPWVLLNSIFLVILIFHNQLREIFSFYNGGVSHSSTSHLNVFM